MEAIDETLASCCMWGWEYARAVLAWVRLLQWPTTDVTDFAGQPCNQHVGISWIELLLNFAIVTQQYPAISVGVGKGFLGGNCSVEHSGNSC